MRKQQLTDLEPQPDIVVEINLDTTGVQVSVKDYTRATRDRGCGVYSSGFCRDFPKSRDPAEVADAMVLMILAAVNEVRLGKPGQCPKCKKLRARISELKEECNDLREEVEDLERQQDEEWGDA